MRDDLPVGLDWEQFLERMRTGLHPDGTDFGRWEVGQHVAVSAPTGEGKTTFAFGLLGLRRYVLALDPKGGDDTARGSGWPRLTSWDSRRVRHIVARNDNADPPRPSRYVVGRLVQTRADRAANRRLCLAALQGCWDLGGWTIYIPDLQMVTDARFMGLSDVIEEMLITARSPKHLTVITDFQRPSRVPVAAGDQTRFFAMGYTRDERMVERFGEMLGRPVYELRGAARGLGNAGPHHWLVGTRNPREPLIVTKPKMIKPRSKAA